MSKRTFYPRKDSSGLKCHRIIFRAIVLRLIAGTLAAFLISTNLPASLAGDDTVEHDPSFGILGKVTTDFGESSGANDVAIQSDGKIVAAGWARSGGVNDFALVRYNPDGSLDTSFSGDGRVKTDFFGGSDMAEGLAIQTDGKIVVAGWATASDNTTDFAIARYNMNGSLDSTFGTGGKATLHFSTNDTLKAVAIQSSGKIVAVGHTYNQPQGKDFVVLRYLTNGTPDTSFGSGGIVLTDFAGTHDEAYDLAIESSSGRIVVAGVMLPEGNASIALAMYDENGDLDTAFAGTGKTVFSGSGSYEVWSVAFAPGGTKILVYGSVISPPNIIYGIVFTFDVPWGAVISTLTTGGGTQLRAVDAAELPSGEFRVLYSSWIVGDGWEDFFVIGRRLFPTEHIGYETTDFSGDSDEPWAIAAYGHDRSIAVGVSTSETGYSRFALARYLTTGVQTSADLNVAMTAAASVSSSSKYITYSITVTNNGLDTAYYVTLKDVIPAGTSFYKFSGAQGWVSTKPAAGAGGTVFSSNAALTAGASVTFTLMVKVNGGLLPGTNISNTAQVSSSFTPDPTGANNSVTLQTHAP
jgi:uncharacterized delta-60 repeat protein/uncharacterized repeat protein (TIGR01451 family)